MNYLQLSEGSSPYVPVIDKRGRKIFVREDFFDQLNETDFENFENENFETQISENNYLSDTEYLADRKARKERREERRKQKEEKRAAKTEIKQAKAEKGRAKAEAIRTKAASGESGGKFDKILKGATDIVKNIKGGGGGSEESAAAETAAETEKSNTMKYLLWGVGGLVLIGGIYLLTKPKK